MPSIYYTQLIFVKPGQEAVFERFEDHVLPLLEKYNGRLLLRWRQTPEGVVGAAFDAPYEVHVVSFATRDDFTAYAKDETRRSYLPLKNQSIERVLLIEGAEI
jgi:hypothetical protein